MANESAARNEEIVDGIYPLGALIARSVRGAIYETKFGEGAAAVRAVIRIREIEPAEAENLIRHLLKIGQLVHPNLLTIYASGSSSLNGVQIFYVVMERADESLEAVLAERRLTKDEMQEMLVPMLDALEYLHKKGYAHSRLRPSNVLGVNDQLKLSSDSIVRAHEGSAAEDIRALGVLIVQALTQKILNADHPWESRYFEEIPQPLADIVRHCLDANAAGRWTAEQIKAEVNARLNPPAAVVENTPVGKKTLAEADPDAPSSHSAPRAGVPKWIYLGLAALILAVVLAAVLRHNDSASVATPTASVTPAPSTDRSVTDPPAVAEPGRSGGGSLRRDTPAPRAEETHAGSRPGERKTSGWSVIVGAYSSRELAEKRMRGMMKRWPRFEINVFETHLEKTPYLVVIGRNLSEDQAQALRKRAVDAGLPGDTYIKRVM